MVTVLEKDCFWALLNVHDLSWQAPTYSVDILLPYHRMVSPPLPPLFSGKSDLWWVKRIPAWRGEGGGGGGGEGS